MNRYEVDLGDMMSNKDDKCYCTTPKTCMKKGVIDVTRCVVLPFFLTLPHFYDTDPEYLQHVEGLNPDKDKHGFHVLIEPVSFR